MHELPDEYLADALPIAKKIALAQGLENYNILQVRSLFVSFLSHLYAALGAEQRAPSAPRSGPCPLPRHSEAKQDRGPRLHSRILACTETVDG